MYNIGSLSHPYMELPIQSRIHGSVVCLIDDEDAPLVNQYRWYVTKQGYVTTVLVTSGKGRQGIKLHRLLMNAPKGVMVDHINRNKLDNRRSNLRLCVRAQNQANRENNPNTDGVSWDKRGNQWVVHVGNGAKRESYKGSFDDKNAALNCYNHYALEKYGEFASLNECEVMSREEWEAKRKLKHYASKYTYVQKGRIFGKSPWYVEVVTFEGKRHYVGYYETEEEAAKARNAYMEQHHLSAGLSVLR